MARRLPAPWRVEEIAGGTLRLKLKPLPTSPRLTRERGAPRGPQYRQAASAAA